MMLHYKLSTFALNPFFENCAGCHYIWTKNDKEFSRPVKVFITIQLNVTIHDYTFLNLGYS